MLRITKNEDELKIKNVICFYVGETEPILSAEEIEKKKEEDWTYQDYLTISCSEHKYNLVWLNKRYVQYSYEEDVININDETTDIHISLNKDNVKNTIIFQGQANDAVGVNYEGLMRAFEYMGFYMINTFDEIRMASDKMLSANLLSSANIPQPNYILVTKNIMQDDSTDTCLTRESFWKLLDSLYDNNNSIDDEKSETKYVVKILGGSLGIGVFLCTRSEIESILQGIFKVDENRELIIQQFKKNTGDIRAHAFSVDGKHYEILACMKRNKISGDFRSNVSLGATTEEYDLDEEQKEIILRTAELSGCRWVGVDLMACEDGSNVVIEYNSSPGVQGISQQIKKNMFDIVLDKVQNYFNDAHVQPVSEFIKDEKCFTNFNEEVVDKLTNIWSELSEERQKVLNKCLSLQPGLYYKLNSKTKPEYGLDCSGLVKYIFKDTLGIKMPDMCIKYFNIYSDSPFEQIDKKDLKPGDIGVKHDKNIDNHCGIYAGDDKWFETNCVYGYQLSNYKNFKFFFRIKDIDK